MNQVDINKTEAGLMVIGDIRFTNVLRLRRLGNDWIDHFSEPDIQIDLSGVASSDTSGLSLLLRWLHHARKQGKSLHYLAIPDSLLKIASVSGVSKFYG